MRRRLLELALWPVVASLMLHCSDDSGPTFSDRSSGWLAIVQDGAVRLIDPDDAGDGPLSPRGGSGPVRWSPDARSLAFEAEGEIMLGLAEGRPRVVTEFAESGRTAHSPHWSPDSSEVAFTIRGAEPGIAIMDARTGTIAEVVNGDVDLGGWWNISGAFAHLVVTDRPAARVYAIDRFGAVPRYLASGTHSVASPADHRVAVIDGDALRVWRGDDDIVTLVEGRPGIADPAWSGDGTAIAFADASGVWIVPADGGEPVEVLKGARIPTWSPDGSEVAAERDGEIVAAPALGGAERVIAAGAAPSWQPPRRLDGPAAVSVDLPRGEPTLPISLEPGDLAPLSSAPAVSLEPAFPNLALGGRIADVVYLGGGVDRFYAVVLQGRIVTFPNDPEVTTATRFLTLPAQINSAREGGLLSLAFDPNFMLNGHFYVYYTTGWFEDGTSAGQPEAPRRNILSRFSVMPGQVDIADPESEFVILDVFPINNATNQHNAGQLAFGPDGYLYLSLGDANTPAHSQDLSRLEGSIIRIDVSNSTPEQPYAIPPDNPFVGVPGAREEIWAQGLRNPWRFSIDPVTGDVWAADVGSNGAISAEEVNLVVPGGNYGWPAREGLRTADCTLYDCTSMIDPLWSYPRGLDPLVPCVAIVGGYVYRGDGLEGLDNAYLVTDLCLTYFWAVRRLPDGTVDVAQIGVSPLGPGGTNDAARISSLSPGPDGEPYIVFNSGAEIWKMVPASQVAQPTPEQDTRPPGVVLAEDGLAAFYQHSCGACHGAEREGDIGPSLTPSLLTQPDAFYFETIANGRPGTAMPSWRSQGLSDAQIAEVVTWLKTTPP